MSTDSHRTRRHQVDGGPELVEQHIQRPSGTTVTSNRGSTRNGNRTEVKSSSAHSTRDPSGRHEATRPDVIDTAPGMATVATGAPVSRAKPSRARATSASKPALSRAADAQASRQPRRTSTAALGGIPTEAVLQ